MPLYFVAGGTSGIGRECVIELLKQGHDVVAIGRTAQHADELREVASPLRHVEIRTGDLTDPEFATKVASTGAPAPVAGLINAVGTISRGGIETESPEAFRHTVRVNLDCAFNLTKALLPRLRTMTGASVVNVSSTCSMRPCDSLAYSVSKAGLDMFTRHLARDLARYAIRVNSVNPGVVATNLHLSAGLFESGDEYDSWVADMAREHPLGAGSAANVCAAIMFFLSPESAWTTGATLVVDGGRSTAGEVLG